MPMHDAPLTVAIFEHRRSQAAAVTMTRFSVIRHVSRNCVFESCPGSVASQVDFDIAKGVLGVLHLTHLRHKMMIAVVSPTIIRVTTLKDSQRLIVGPDL